MMGVVLLVDQASEEIRYIFAPDIRYNETKGVFPVFRLYGFPGGTREYSVAIGKSTTRDEFYKLHFEDWALWNDRMFFLGHAEYDRDSTQRFWGFGNDSRESDETNYTGADFEATMTPGIWILPSVYLSYQMRFRYLEVQRGQVDRCEGQSPCPYTLTRFPGLATSDQDEGFMWAHLLALSYDSRDSLDLPTEGQLGRLYLEAADRQLGSSASFVKFGIEGRTFIPFRAAAKNPVLALRAGLDYVSGSSDTPFWERSSLGGKRSLRGFGSDRFIDFNRSLVSAELRTRVYQRELFGTHVELELAPFLETGQVFPDVTSSPVDDLHFVFGLGTRFLARPKVIAFVDLGMADEGLKVFTGIDYPF
jgi:outer membrane protein assembly factor BamA